MTDLKARADALRELLAKATQEELRDQGRYFAETCDDLTRCRHGETGEYLNEHDGRYIEALWNTAPSLLDELDRLRDALAASEARAVKLREELRQIYVDATEQHADWCNMGPVEDEARNWAFDMSQIALEALTAAQEKNDD